MSAGTKTSTPEWISLARNFRTPYDIQEYLDTIEYKSGAGTISPLEVIRRKEANCFEGALFAAAVLKLLGQKPLILDIIAENDDDHVIAIFRRNGCYGAVAKSNTTLLRYREPVYRTLRELIMSYFDFYFNTLGEKSMRSYSNPVDLSRFDKYEWITSADNLDFIGDYLNDVKHHDVTTASQRRFLSRAGKYLVAVCFSGAIDEGLYKPEKS